MSNVASHLGIQLDEYDARIRTFVPYYEEMLHVVAAALGLLTTEQPVIIDLGVGTGALSAQCLAVRPGAILIGIDSDPAMLRHAYTRLAHYETAELRFGNFMDAELPPCDAIVASLALHHVATAEVKQQLYARCFAALRPGGVLLSADCYPASTPALAEAGRQLWLRHLEQHYSIPEAEKFLSDWANEDTYFPLHDELDWLRKAGFVTDVVWRRDPFAVLAGAKKS